MQQKEAPVALVAFLEIRYINSAADILNAAYILNWLLHLRRLSPSMRVLRLVCERVVISLELFLSLGLHAIAC